MKLPNDDVTAPFQMPDVQPRRRAATHRRRRSGQEEPEEEEDGSGFGGWKLGKDSLVMMQREKKV